MVSAPNMLRPAATGLQECIFMSSVVTKCIQYTKKRRDIKKSHINPKNKSLVCNNAKQNTVVNWKWKGVRGENENNNYYYSFFLHLFTTLISPGILIFSGLQDGKKKTKVEREVRTYKFLEITRTCLRLQMY
jgi:hypothetical protein